MNVRGGLPWAAIGVVAAAAVLAFVLATTGGGSRASAQNASPASTAASATAAATAAKAAAVPAVALKLVASGFSSPLGVTAPPGDTRRLFVVDKVGKIRVIANGTLLAKPFLNLTGRVSGGTEQGLLSLAFDPHYTRNGHFYVFYTNRVGDIRVVRYTVSSGNRNVVNPSSAKVLVKIAHHAHSNHNGGQLAFGPDGRLYIGVGDGGSEGDPNLYGQNTHVPYAKIWRLNITTFHKQLYAYGLRNPWRFSFDAKNGNLWIGDVGQNNWEEIDFLKADTKAGTNFGWSYYEGDHTYKSQHIVRTRLVFPVTEYSHAVGDAVVGGYVYRGSAIPALKGDYLYADYGTGRVWFKAGSHAPAHILTGISQKLTLVSSFGQDTSGELYLSSLNNGNVYELAP